MAARERREHVDERVRVGGHEVQRPIVVADVRVDALPPAPGHARVADVGAAEQLNAQVQPPLGDLQQTRAGAAAPRRVQALPVRPRAAEQLRGLVRRRRRRAGHAQAGTQLVPLDLVGDERRHEVVEVRGRGQQHREAAVTGVVPVAAPGRGAERRPVGGEAEAGLRERLGLLAHDDQTCVRDRVREAAGGVDEGAQVDLVRRRVRVQRGAHRAVGGLEHAQQRLPRGAQQRRVGAVVELDLVGELAGGRADRAAGRCRGNAWHVSDARRGCRRPRAGASGRPGRRPRSA